MISEQNIHKIDNNTIYLQNICKKKILFKYTCKGIRFLTLEKNKVINANILERKQLYNIFNSFTQPMYETLLEDISTKIYLDLDFTNISKDIYNDKNNVFLKFNNYFVEFLDNKKINYKNIVYMDASRQCGINMYKLSLHVIVNGVAFKNRKTLKKLIIEFKNQLQNETLYYEAIDISIYNFPQLFKCVLSPSKNDNTLLLPLNIENNNIIYANINKITNNILDYLVGVYTNDVVYIDDKFTYLLKDIDFEKSINSKPKKIEKSINTKDIDFEKSIIPDNKKKWIENNKYIKNIYKLRNNYIINNKIDLLRINSAYCKICKRNHNSENAFCKISENAMFFHCGRNTSKGVAIGYWYSNYKTYDKNNVANNDTNKNDLNNIIDELKNYIYNLEEKYNKLKEEFNLLSTIHNKCNDVITNIKNNNNITNNISKKYTKDVKSEMWQKYYRLGESISKGLDDLANNIIKSWKDRSIGRLKNRSLLIYEYINYINSNNIVNKLSMRKIFHKKNYETFSSLL